MKLSNLLTISSVLATGALLSACGGGSSTPKTTVTAVCSDVTSCVQDANGFTFPDGAGGTITCTSGKCTIDNEKLNDSIAAYAQGNADGKAAANANDPVDPKAYDNGYAAGLPNSPQKSYDKGNAQGQADVIAANQSKINNAYDNGYSDGKSAAGSYTGYTSGQWDGEDDGQADGKKDGYNDGYDDGKYAGGDYNSGYNDGYSDGYDDGKSDGTYGYSVIGATKDTDLQKAKTQRASTEKRAQSIAQQFGMSVDSARKITDLSDQVRSMALAGQMTAADRAAITKSALKIAGVTTAQVNTALSSAMKGNLKPVNDVMEQAAKNMGMNSGADLRDKLLPSMGLSM